SPGRRQQRWWPPRMRARPGRRSWMRELPSVAPEVGALGELVAAAREESAQGAGLRGVGTEKLAHHHAIGALGAGPGLEGTLQARRDVPAGIAAGSGVDPPGEFGSDATGRVEPGGCDDRDEYALQPPFAVGDQGRGGDGRATRHDALEHVAQSLQDEL